MKIKQLKNLTKILLIIIPISMAFSGEIYKEFEKTRKEIVDLNDSPEKRKKQLEETLLINLKRVLNRYFRYPDYNKIKTTDFKYERADYTPNTKEDREFIYYVKYKDYIGKFIFQVNPETNLAYPSQEKFFKKPKKN